MTAGGETCLICLEPFSGLEDYAVALPCHEAHVYHKSCIELWLLEGEQSAGRMACPICRVNAWEHCPRGLFSIKRPHTNSNNLKPELKVTPDLFAPKSSAQGWTYDIFGMKTKSADNAMKYILFSQLSSETPQRVAEQLDTSTMSLIAKTNLKIAACLNAHYNKDRTKRGFSPAPYHALKEAMMREHTALNKAVQDPNVFKLKAAIIIALIQTPHLPRNYPLRLMLAYSVFKEPGCRHTSSVTPGGELQKEVDLREWKVIAETIVAEIAEKLEDILKMPHGSPERTAAIPISAIYLRAVRGPEVAKQTTITTLPTTETMSHVCEAGSSIAPGGRVWVPTNLALWQKSTEKPEIDGTDSLEEARDEAP